jgi:hypothetical protein
MSVRSRRARELAALAPRSVMSIDIHAGACSVDRKLSQRETSAEWVR